MSELAPVFNLVINDEGNLRELGLLTEQNAYRLLRFVERGLAEGAWDNPEAVEEIAQRLREWLGEPDV